MIEHPLPPVRLVSGPQLIADNTFLCYLVSITTITTNSNEAPYLKEWIEYHRMIGFDSFILMNDRSKDSTQCILDAYAQEGVVHLFDKHLGFRRIGQGRVFEACVNYLNMITTDSEQVWLATHDTDEFIWFNKTETNNHFARTCYPGYGSIENKSCHL